MQYRWMGILLLAGCSPVLDMATDFEGIAQVGRHEASFRQNKTIDLTAQGVKSDREVYYSCQTKVEGHLGRALCFLSPKYPDRIQVYMFDAQHAPVGKSMHVKLLDKINVTQEFKSANEMDAALVNQRHH